MGDHPGSRAEAGAEENPGRCIFPGAGDILGALALGRIALLGAWNEVGVLTFDLDHPLFVAVVDVSVGEVGEHHTLLHVILEPLGGEFFVGDVSSLACFGLFEFDSSLGIALSGLGKIPFELAG